MPRSGATQSCPTCKIHDHDTLRFPKGFLWGASTSAHQVEGGLTNDWQQWEDQEGNIHDNTTSERAADHVHRYKDDFALAKKLGHNIHRLSISWSRVEPESGVFDKAAIAHYHNVLTELQKKNIKVMVTLHHFTNPVWFVEKGGWESRRAPAYFKRFAQRMIKEYHKKVDYWISINEPNVYTSNSFLKGEWPPQRTSLFAYLRVMRHLTKAHIHVHHLVHHYAKNPQVGIAKNTHDFIGVNYYFHVRVRKSGLFKIKTADAREEHREGSDLGWELHPNGLFQAIMNMHQYKLPIIITENGLAAINDHRRSRFIVSHVKEVYHAIKAGADVRGYCYWSLIDNFEWNKGYEPRFGLIGIEYSTMKRTPRNSAYVYAKICKKNGIPHDLMRFLGHSADDEPPL